MATRRFDDVYICQSIELLDDEGRTVGRATHVPYIGRLFKYRHRAGTPETLFRFESKDRARYASGHRFWESAS